MVLEVRSSVGGIPASRWVLHGAPIEVEVPASVQAGDRVRYRFREWSGGENPFTPRNVIAPLEPMTLEVDWDKEYLITVEGSANGRQNTSVWYPEGETLVLQAPEVVGVGNGTGRAVQRGEYPKRSPTRTDPMRRMQQEPLRVLGGGLRACSAHVTPSL